MRFPDLGIVVLGFICQDLRFPMAACTLQLIFLESFCCAVAPAAAPPFITCERLTREMHRRRLRNAALPVAASRDPGLFVGDNHFISTSYFG